MKINWKVRLNNPQFIWQVVVAVLLPILTYAGLTAEDLTSWAVLGELMVDAISNPYVLGLIGISVYNAINDPTVKGLGDSRQALQYDKPKEDK